MQPTGRMTKVNTEGKPPMNRGQRRMTEFNSKKYASAAPATEWDEDYDAKWGPPEQHFGARRATNKKPTPRTMAWKKGKANSSETSGIVKAKSENLQDEPLWQDGPYAGTHPTSRIYCQNLDFSSFPLLCERVYTDLESENPRPRREMPYCSFQHTMTSILNAHIIDHARTVNAEDRYADEESPFNLLPDHLCVPAPIAEYLKMISNTVTPAGDVVKANFPDTAIPATAVAADDQIPEQPSGGFGPRGAANRNSYECYVSPLVTSRLVEATVDQNSTHRFGPWDPLPDGMMPVGGTPTTNLLGYRVNVEICLATASR